MDEIVFGKLKGANPYTDKKTGEQKPSSYDLKGKIAKDISEILNQEVLITGAYVPPKVVSKALDAVCFEVADKGTFLTIGKVLYDQYQRFMKPSLQAGQPIRATLRRAEGNYYIWE